MSKPRHTMTDHEMAVCMGTDAMRVLLGLPPKNFAVDEIAAVMQLIADAKKRKATLDTVSEE
jgi:hypothetical protein